MDNEPDTPGIFVQWMTFRGDVEIHMGETAGCYAVDLAWDTQLQAVKTLVCQHLPSHRGQSCCEGWTLSVSELVQWFWWADWLSRPARERQEPTKGFEIEPPEGDIRPQAFELCHPLSSGDAFVTIRGAITKLMLTQTRCWGKQNSCCCFCNRSTQPVREVCNSVFVLCIHNLLYTFYCSTCFKLRSKKPLSFCKYFGMDLLE